MCTVCMYLQYIVSTTARPIGEHQPTPCKPHNSDWRPLGATAGLFSGPADSAWWINSTLSSEYIKIQHSTPQQGTAQQSAVQCKGNLFREYFIQYQSNCYSDDKDDKHEYNNEFYWPLLVFLSLEQKMEGMLTMYVFTYALLYVFMYALLYVFMYAYMA